jgi:Flp pilus assembly protein TadG
VAATELALVLPFLALLFCVTVDFCRAFHTAQVVDSCARNGALYAGGTAASDPNSTTPDAAARQAAVNEGASLNPPLQAEDVSVTIAPEGATVTVNYRFALLTSYTGFSSAITITRTVTTPIAPKSPGAP